jgi:hypothetical protein
MSAIIPPAPSARQPGETWTADRLAAELVRQQWTQQPYEAAIERRLAALEEAVVSGRARRRLRRGIRRRLRQFAWAGPDFWSRRTEDLGNEILADGAGCGQHS